MGRYTISRPALPAGKRSRLRLLLAAVVGAAQRFAAWVVLAPLLAGGCGPGGFPGDRTPGPDADASRTATRATAGASGTVSLTLDGTASRADDSPITSYQWLRNDAVIGSGPRAEVTLSAGSHEIVLVVIDEQGRSDRETVTVVVAGSPRSSYALTIEVFGRGATTPGPGTTDWSAGRSIELRAVPEEGWQFVRWNGDLPANESVRTIVMDRDWYILAEFAPVSSESVPKFFLPLPAGQKRTVSQGNLELTSHRGRHAWDFPMPIGTPVLAVAAGRVIEVYEETWRNTQGEPPVSDRANYVKIDHGGGLVSVYAHLDFHGAVVEAGQYVVRGQVIGLSCDTGISTGPHLHYEIVNALNDSVPSGLWDFAENDGVPVTDDVVESRNELSLESIYGYRPSDMPVDAFAENGIELVGLPPPAFFYTSETDYVLTGRVRDGHRVVCLALVDPASFDTVFCDLTEVLDDGSFVIPVRFPRSLEGRYYMGVIGGDGGAAGLTPVSVLIERAADAVPAPAALIDAPGETELDFGSVGSLRGGRSVSHRGVPLSYQWVQASGPPATLEDQTAPETEFTITPGEGIARVSFQLVVSDGVRRSAPAQVEFFMPDTFYVRNINVADFVCGGVEECPDLHPPLVSLSSGVLAGWVEIFNAETGDQLTFEIVTPGAEPVRTASLTMSGLPPSPSFWRFAWSTDGIPLTAGLWSGNFKRNGVTEATVSFRVMP
jgi:murein DD-endopeptidase MepM/ murein hydrolase activator NlpD